MGEDERLCEHACKCVLLCVCVCVWAGSSVYVVSARVIKFVCGRNCVCECWRVSVREKERLSEHACKCEFLRVFVCVCLCVCVCLSV